MATMSSEVNLSKVKKSCDCGPQTIPDCPVCLKPLNPPTRIFQCAQGHYLCEECEGNPALVWCPSCRGPIVGRNIGMEQVLEKLYSIWLALPLQIQASETVRLTGAGQGVLTNCFAILRNKNIVIGSTMDNSVNILLPGGSFLKTVEQVRPFIKPTHVTVLSTGEFVVVDDFGLQMFNPEGVFVKPLGEEECDRYYGLAEDKDGNIVTINCAPLSGQTGGVTQKGETDIFFISKESGHVIKRIILEDIIDDKKKSQCRDIYCQNETLYIVDTGLDCVYKLKLWGNVTEKVGETGTEPMQFRKPSAIIEDNFGNFLVADAGNDRIQIFDQDQNYVGTLSVPSPCSIHLDQGQRELIILRYQDNTLVKYRL